MKLPKLKSSAKLALFSTAMMLVAMSIIYASMYYSFNQRLHAIQETLSAGTGETTIQNIGGMSFEAIIVPLLMVVLFSFLISSLIIDRVLNPVRVMIEKVKSIGDKNFKSKIFIDSAEDELREYAYAFNTMTSKINEYVEKQKRFISDASHELVTPITVIAGHADMLLRWGKENRTTLDSGLGTIRTEALAMNQLIENLLFLARTDNGKIQYEMKRVDLPSLLDESAQEQRLLHPDFSINFSGSKPLFVLADAAALRQVIRIICANSVKYSMDTKAITIHGMQEEQMAVIRITDQGIGIDSGIINRIFERFFRVDDSRTKETGGTGLGLAIAKEIIEAHYGVITARSVVNEGTTIEISLRITSSSDLHDVPMTYS